jgi:hypothetical protein
LKSLSVAHAHLTAGLKSVNLSASIAVLLAVALIVAIFGVR